MLRRRHNVVLQSRPFAVGQAPRRSPRSVQSIIRSLDKRSHSTVGAQPATEGPVSAPVETVSSKSTASESAPTTSAFTKKPIVVRKIKTERKVDPRASHLSEWVNKTKIRTVRNSNRIGPENDGSGIENSQSTDIQDPPDNAVGNTRPRILRMYKGVRETAKPGLHNQRSELFRKILGEYQEQRQSPKWQPDVIEGLDQEADLVKRTENAWPLIDQTLRRKLLSRYQDIPVEEPEEEVDIGNMASAFANLKPPEDEYFAKSADLLRLAENLPPPAAETLRQARRMGLLAKVKVTDEVLTSLHSSEDWELFLKCLQADSIAQSLGTILDTLEKGPIKLTREIAQPLLLASGNLGRVDAVRRIMHLCEKERVPVTHAHWVRAVRMECKQDQSKYKDIPLLITEVARRGFDERAYSFLMAIYADMRRMDTVVALFNNYDQFVRTSQGLKFNYIHNTLLETFVPGGMAEEAEYIFQAMKNRINGAPLPDAETYGIVAQVYGRRPDYYPKLMALINDYLQSHLPFNQILFGALMKAGAYAGRLDVATLTFDHFYSRRDLTLTKTLFTDYLSALMFAKVDPTDEGAIAIGLPMYEKLPLDARDSKEIDNPENEEEIPAGEPTDPGNDKKYMIPVAPSTPQTAGELLALIDLQYQHIRKFRPRLNSHQNQRNFLRIFISHKFYNTFKKAYRYLALVTGLRGKKSIFPGYERKTKISFADFAKGAEPETSIDPGERYEFDYLHYPLTWIEAFPALRAAYETRDLDFAHSVIADYDNLLENHPKGGINLREIVREMWVLKAEAMCINTLAVCDDMEAAGKRFDRAIDTIKWDMDRPRLFAKAIAVYTGLLAMKSDGEKTRYAFRRLQEIEMEMRK
ncbi:hypothetical protein TWF694_007070 [Orbilia ellipsospora]|uniref:Pentatricopeptide repeat protein n=1 Tax=Orbilia ellipsospora TaxID=2528407 RepID=A0AAV9XMF4_9PEZI